MPETRPNQCLSSADAFFLYLERPGAPMNVASISVFEGVITLAECTRHLRSRLPLIPRFTERVVPPPFGIGLPKWQLDSLFDLRNHVHEIELARGSEPEFKDAVSRILSTHLDRNLPLWDLTLIHGLRRQRTGLVLRCHHCLIDGIAGVKLLKLLLDETAISPKPARVRRAQATAAPGDSASILLEGVLNSCFSSAQALLTAHSGLLKMAQHVSTPRPAESRNSALDVELHASAGGSMAQLTDIVRSLSEFTRLTQRLPYNVLCHGPQKFEWTELPMDEVIAVKHACSATVNDVVLTVIAATLRCYAELHKQNTRGRMLRIVIPVNLRESPVANDTGNDITFLPIDIPIGACRPKALLSTVQRQTALSRTARAGELVGLTATVLGALPSSLQSVVGNVLSQLPISVCNSICTNVPGPRTALYLNGHKMLSSYPYVPIGGEMGMNCAVLSYNGTLFVGFTGDAGAIRDIEHLPVFFRQSFAELKADVGVRVQKKRSPRRLQKPVAASGIETTSKRELKSEQKKIRVVPPEKVVAAASA